MTQETIDQYIFRFLDGSASREEEQALRNWRGLKEENETYFKHFRQIWQLSRLEHIQKQKPQFDKKKAWEKIKPQEKTIASPGFRIGHYLNRTTAAIAAMLVAGLVIFFQFFYHPSPENIHFVAQSIEELSLPDGSIITLNEGAVIDYPEAFTGEQRAIKFQGEAFFDIAKNPDKRFIIQMKNTRVEVLGTSFNILEKPNEEVEVSVQSGKVAFYAAEIQNEHAEEEDKIIMTQGDAAVYRPAVDKIEPIKIPSLNSTSWKTKIFTFNETPLPIVIADLSKGYKVKFIIDDPALNTCSLSMYNRKAQSLDQVLQTIELSLGISIEKKQDGYHLKGSCE
ncbi:FecR family protein [Persicobacter diffluens]|uniref:Anti-sigma factor n=1 Tax=Persicobacter diffluens TaxID=981 RepID=A0AAN4W1I6_9BACT|nr:anti-sigma factor [Persicobacter diffluens]